MPVIVDAMGGDHAPREIVLGALDAAREHGIEVVLVGQESAIRGCLEGRTWEKASSGLPVSIVHAPDFITMEDEHPAKTLRKKPESSLRVAARLVKGREDSALISAGHTGAVMAAALFDVGRMEGVERPGIAAVIPTLAGPVVVCDVGANVDCKPLHLLRFAQMGIAYAEHILGVAKPRVGLLNIGSEASKGNELAQQSHELLVKFCPSFAGNVEPNTLFEGNFHVVVTDGFAGNIFLKSVEGVAHTIKAKLKRTAESMGIPGPILRIVQDGLARFNPESPENSGAPLLGVNRPCIITHGASKAETFKHGVQLAHRFATSRTLESIRQHSGQESV